MRPNASRLLILMACLIVAGCSVVPPKSFPRADKIDLDRYMGKWYVIAHIPPGPTKNSYNSIESYEQTEPGKIATTFTYREGGFDGENKTMHPTGSVIDGTGDAVWAMRFYWVLRMQYVISYVSPDYQTTIVARDKRDYAWIMARTPKIDSKTYDSLTKRVKDIGYDTSKLRRVPQQPLAERDDG